MNQGAGQNASDSTASFFWYVVLLTVAVILAWVFGKKYLVPPMFFIRVGEIHLIEWVLAGWNYIAGLIHLPLANLGRYEHIQHFMQTMDPKKVTMNQVNYISDQIGIMYRYPLALIILGMAYISFFRHRSAQFVNTYSMKSLKKFEVVNWPHITPVLPLDLVKKKLDEGPWAMAEMPLHFCKRNNILGLTEKNDKKIWTIVHGAAERIFVMQMGSLWEGVEKLPIHIKALIVICVCRVDRRKDMANKYLDQIAISSGTDSFNFAGIEEELEKCKNHKVLKWIEKRHAYVFTVMATLIAIARVEGVLATAEFIWLKPVDRRLWYVLNTVGRTTAVVEVSGVYAHWLAEKKIKRALRTPVVNEAVIALDKAVGNILYTEDEEQWHTSNAA